MQSDSLELQEFARLLSSLVRSLQPSAEVTLTEEGFLGDVLYAQISLGRRRRPYDRGAIRERGPVGTYGRVRARPMNLLMTAEWAREFMGDPGRYLSTLEWVISQASREPQTVAFWLLTTGGVEEKRVGTGIVGLSDDYIQDLADRLAIQEGRREFATWLSAHAPGDDHGDNR